MPAEHVATVRRHRLVAAVLLAVLIALVTPGCGDGSDREHERGEAAEEAENAQAEALARVPDADRTAFFQLATAIGTLRARAAPVAVGSSESLSSAAPVRSARGQVVALRPEDSQLARLRDRLIPVLAAFARAPRSGAASRRASRAAIGEADRIEAGLRSYTQRTPAIGGAIPD